VSSLVARACEGLGHAVSALRARPRHVVLGAAVAGLVVGASVQEGSAAPGLTIFAAAACALLAGRRTAALAATFAVFAGASLAEMRLRAIDATALGGTWDLTSTELATLLEHPRRGARGGERAVVRLDSGRAGGERVLVTAPWGGRFPAAAIGAGLRLDGKLMPLPRAYVHYRRRGVHALVRARAIRLDGRRRTGAVGALDAIRRRAETALDTGLRPGESALYRGLVLGQDEALAESEREAFRRAGLSHLLAASGANVMMLATLALLLGALAGISLRARLGAALVLALLYVPLAGAGPSIVRAGVMGAAGLVAGLAGRPGSRWYALLAAAAVSLIANPRAPSDVGWQLSFAAVVAILLLAHRMAERLEARGLPAPIASAAALTAAATIGTAPLIAFHFGRLSLVSLPANLLAAPAVAPVMWLGAAAAALGQVWMPAAAIPNALAALPLAYLEQVAAWAAAPSFAQHDVRIPSGAWLALVYALLATVVLLVARVPRSRRPIALACVAALAFVAIGAARTPVAPRDLTVSFLDVGQGDATLIQHDGVAVLFDAGLPESPVLARLRAAGVTRLDLLVVTHPEADHEGGAAAVLDALPVGLLLDGGAGAGDPLHRALVAAAVRHGVRRLVPGAGQELRVGPLTIRVLWPRREPSWRWDEVNPNDRAVVAQLRDGDFDLLLPADAESNVTAGLDLPPVDVLKVAHHGSEDEGLAGLLARLRPRIAAISVGEHNTYGHPTAQALTALRVVPQVFRTDRDGTVRVTVRAGAMSVSRDP
jgi:competence protein ComEC